MMKKKGGNNRRIWKPHMTAMSQKYDRIVIFRIKKEDTFV